MVNDTHDETAAHHSMTQDERFAKYPSLGDVPVLITGGASGIGAAMVEQFARQGARVAFLDLAEENAATLEKKLEKTSSHAPVFFSCDLKNIDVLRSVISKVEEQFGSIRVLVNNAANDDRHKFSEVTPEYWDERMNVNLRHHFFAMQAVIPGMTRAGGGSIINMSSISWIIPSTGLPAYIAAKAGIIGLTRTMSRELGAANIRVNSVSPGAIMTERQRRLWMTPDYLAEVMGAQALKRELLPDDVARVALFLASDDSSTITGQNFIIDGGWV
ncbi:MAG TPA: SDR family oxidoreductase [Terriglobales bacterium]|jgi:NAD(P)-dependent dehydrogenase (short-subunit alcohol dehydrogenase family)